MTAFKTKEELLQIVNSGFQSLNQGAIDLDQMNDLVNSTRELYERALIIRHKAQELFVADKPISFEQDILSTNATVQTPVHEVNTNNVSAITEETTDTPILDEIASNPSKQETFSVEEKEEGFSFDLFDIPSEKDEIIEHRIEEETIFTPKAETQTIVEEVVSHQETAETEIKQEVDVELPKSIAEIMTENPFDFSSNVTIEEVQQEEVAPISETPVSTFEIGDTSFFNNYQALSQNPSAMMIAPKIESLTGAFGLGEKLMYIRELFNGSSDAFNQVIAEIEKGQSFDDAKLLLSVIANDNAWDLSNQATLDFINKVERRFF